jgi:hypothetical protein
MKKQSSIDWFFEQLEFNESVSRYEIFEQAKQMHTQEIIEARNDGFDSTYAEYGETPKCYLDGSSEEYYNETFKSE